MSLGLISFREELAKHCQKCGRSLNQVRLVAVSKLQSLEKIQQAHSLGQLDFGENYVQEALEKQKSLGKTDFKWHMIGPLQKNKINKVIGAFELIHSVDSFETAEQIHIKSEQKNIRQPVLLQINLSGETTKSGLTELEFRKNWSQFCALKNLEIRGLMTLPPLEKARPYFQQLRKVAEEFSLKELSMGTSSDWKEAVEEGATYIRIGTAVFGERIK